VEAGRVIHQVETGTCSARRRLEAGITALALHHQVAPPTINLDCPDPDCDLDYVPKAKRELPMRYALSNSFGFGGTNVALLLKRAGDA
jgi:3-oxoacyl-[acyl-carrier-protein] synthase II